MEEMERKQKNFIEEIVEEDLRTGRVKKFILVFRLSPTVIFI